MPTFVHSNRQQHNRPWQKHNPARVKYDLLLTGTLSAAGMLGNLPAAVTTFAACPVPVGVAGDRGSGSGAGGDAAAVLAVVTAAGTLEIATLRRGALSPLSAAVTLSLGEHKWGCRKSAEGIAVTAAAEVVWRMLYLCTLGMFQLAV